MQSTATSVEAYLAELSPERRAIVSAVREVVLANLDRDYEEGMQYGMIGYYVPHRVYKAGYHTDPRQPLPFAALASQKGYVSLYLAGTYCGCGQPGEGETADATWFRTAWLATGRKLDMGKSCIRFKSLDAVPLDVVGEAIRRIPARVFVEQYQAAQAHAAARRADTPPKRR